MASHAKQTCLDCKKPVCSHCCVEISNSPVKKYENDLSPAFGEASCNLSEHFRSICLCHVCSEVRDIYKKTGAWFYKGLPNYEIPSRSNGDLKSEARELPPKVTKTTKLGMEIDSDEDEDDGADITMKDEQKFVKNGSFSSNFLKSRNLFNLRLSTDSGSRLTFDSNSSLPKKSPVTPYSRQTSSSDSQKSANSLQPQISEWESGSPNNVLHRQRRNSISSCYSITEGSSATENFMMTQSEWKNWLRQQFLRNFLLFRLSWTNCSWLAGSFNQLRRNTRHFVLHASTCTRLAADGFTRAIRSFLQSEYYHCW